MQQPPSQGVGGKGDLQPSTQSPGTITTTTSTRPHQSQGSGVSGAANELKADAQQLSSKAASRLHSEVDARKGTAVNQARTVCTAATARGSPAGTASSVSDTRRQWAPVHLR